MLIPMQDNMILELIDQPLISGIVMPDSFEAEKDESAMFRVVAVGPGYWLEGGKFVDSKVSVGTTVIVSAYGLSRFKYEGKKVIIGRERDIAFIVSGDKKKGK
jgi:co-chaperonin GroES (HSP10)